MPVSQFHFDQPVAMPTVRPRRGGSAAGEPPPERPAFQASIVVAMARHIVQGSWVSAGPRSIAEEIRRVTNAVRVVFTIDNGTNSTQATICGASGMEASTWSHEFEQATLAAANETKDGAPRSIPRDATAVALRRLAVLNQTEHAVGLRIPVLDRSLSLLVIGPTPTLDWQLLLQSELPGLTKILECWLAMERGNSLPKNPKWNERIRSRSGRWMAVAGLGLAAVLCIPWPYHVRAKVTMEPAVRTILSAPFAGRLEKTLVEPGDVVTAGQTLVRLDPRDLQVELAAAEAEEREVAARHQGALAGRQGNSSLVTKLELEQIQFKVQTLRRRLERLEIKSSLDGVVVRGDLQRLEGAPLTAGQTLLEVAAMEDLIAEVAIPEYQIEHVREAMTVDIHLDAFPYRSWQGTITRIHPRSELQHNDSVYIAEVKLAGDVVALRPGMNGRASVTSDKHPLAWNLFHRPLANLLQFAGW